ncbi:hypothetical protein [Micromonospora sp. NBC_01412]|uniref:hypothetical protein n=1 Tax=Micromonospora sp. NBC_01412 TaxID=2903590 RepID=UPI0032479BDA
MPDPVAVTDRRESRLLPVLFWTGVAFAPVAALILLVADGNGPLRFAAVLAITAVVLIGLSIALRTDGDGSRAEIEALHDEIEELRRELRGEMVGAAQRGNQALDASQRAQDQVAALRRRLDAVATAAAPEPSVEKPAGAGRARVPLAEVYDDAHRHREIDEAPAGRVRVPGTAHDDEPPVHRPRPTPRYGAERPAQPGGPGPAPRRAVPDTRSSGPVAPEPAPRPVGMVRHTETVHVTTRHTVVDGPESGMGLYGAGPAGRWPPTPQEPGRPDDAGRAGQYGDAGRAGRYDHADGSGHRDGYDQADGPGWGGHVDEPGRGGGAGRGGEPGRGGRADESGGIRAGVPDGARHADRGSWAAPGWSAEAGRARPYPPEPAIEGPGQRSELRAGERWAEVHDDERGREVRVGERRAAAHTDAAGSGYRVEDHWASVRRSEPRPGRGQGERRWDEDLGGRRPDPDPGGRRPDPDRTGPWPDADRRDAPPAGQWRAGEPGPDRTGRHQHADEEWYGHPPRDDTPRAGGTRAADRRP